MKKNIKNIVFLILAFICLGVGVIGVVLPILPTTPFLLLASICFAKGSERFNRWFLATKLYQRHLQTFITTRSMTLKTKLSILIPATLMMLAAMYFVPIWHAQLAIGIMILFKYCYFIFRIKTIKNESSEEETAKSAK